MEIVSKIEALKKWEALKDSIKAEMINDKSGGAMPPL